MGLGLGGPFKAAPLYAYQFVRAGSVDLTLSGFFVDATGAACSPSFTGTISTTPVSFADVSGAALPKSAVGFWGRLVNASDLTGICIGLGLQADGTLGVGLSTVDATKCPQIGPTDSFILGTVG